MLKQVTESDLKDWGITSFQHKKILIRYIEKLTENDEAPEIEYDHQLSKNLNLSIDMSRRNLDIDESNNDADKADDQKIRPIKEDEEQDPETKEETMESPVVRKNPSFSVSDSVKQLLDHHKEPKKREWRYKDGMLSVLVVKATNVDNKDGKDGVSDPYVELDLKGNYKKENTQWKQDDANPVWNERFQLLVDNAKEDVLKATIWDHDKFMFDDKVGTVCVPIIDICNANGKLRKEYDVVGSEIGCKLELEFKYWEA